jgi:hypothetical protein
MTTVTKEDKNTTNQQKQTRNRRRNNIKENIHGDSRGRRKGGENLNKRELPTTKPVIGSSNPFFIAVCAPETYAPNVTTAVGVGNQRVKANVFLRARPRTSNNVGSNHFIHHPTLQHSRHVDVPSTAAASVSSAAASAPSSDILSSSDLSHFPSLGGAKSATTAAVTTVKLNFKEMMMRGAAATASGDDSPAAAAIPVTVPVVVYSRQPIYQKQLSSGNIFSAAFHSPQDGEGDGDGDGDGDGEGDVYESTIASSVLIDSCDNKYDRLYR